MASRGGSRTLAGFLMLCVTLLVLIWASAVYQLVVGREIEARVVSCHYRSCDVSWVDGSEHGVNSTDGVGARPGQVIKVFRTRAFGGGVTSQTGLVLTAWGLPLLPLIIWGLTLLRRRRRALAPPAG